MTQKPSSLTAELLSKKPPISATGAPVEPLDAEEAEIPVPEPVIVPGPDRSLSCKVDAGRYRRMGQARLDLSKTNQDILSEGLDLWLKKYKR